MPQIFISYRRADTGDVAGRLYDRFIRTFGKHRVFKDIHSIPLGEDFRKVIERKLIQADVLIVLIGSNWLSIEDAEGKRRLDNPNDFVRLEVELGLRHCKRVIPVLINTTAMPKSDALPVSMRSLVDRHAATVRSGRDFANDVNGLIDSILQSSSRKLRFILKMIAMSALGISLGLVVFRVIGSPPLPTPIETNVATHTEAITFTPSETNHTLEPTETALLTPTLTILPTLFDTPTALPSAVPTNTLVLTATLIPSETATTITVPTATSTINVTPTPTATTTLMPTVTLASTSTNTLSWESAAYLTATAQASTYSTCNLSNCNPLWTPIASIDFGTHQMVFVPGQGSILPFWIDQTEVSIDDYQRCDDPRCNGNPNPNGWSDFGFPAAGITPQQAQDYCQWALGESGGLPSLEQWIYAAGGGPIPRTYSWGELIENSAEELQPARYDRTSTENGLRLPVRVGIELHYSWVGVTNMSGNIRELVSNGNDYFAVGGHYGSGLAELVIPRPNSSPSLSIGLNDFDQRTGFRCVRAYSVQ